MEADGLEERSWNTRLVNAGRGREGLVFDGPIVFRLTRLGCRSIGGGIAGSRAFEDVGEVFVGMMSFDIVVFPNVSTSCSSSESSRPSTPSSEFSSLSGGRCNKTDEAGDISPVVSPSSPWNGRDFWPFSSRGTRPCSIATYPVVAAT